MNLNKSQSSKEILIHQGVHPKDFNPNNKTHEINLALQDLVSFASITIRRFEVISTEWFLDIQCNIQPWNKTGWQPCF